MDISQKIASLKPREREVLGLMADGCRVKEAARAIGLHPAVVGIYARDAARKLGARHAWHAAILLLKNV